MPVPICYEANLLLLLLEKFLSSFGNDEAETKKLGNDPKVATPKFL